MSKYDRLGLYLRQQGLDAIPLSFAEIERIVGTKLPKSREHQAWWSNSTGNNVMTKVWLDAGYQTERVDMEAKKLVFRRVGPPAGMAEEPGDFQRDENKKPRRHPAFGALKGTFTIEPGWDLARPSLDPDELAEWEASLDRKADMYEKGLSGKK